MLALSDDATVGDNNEDREASVEIDASAVRADEPVPEEL